MNRYEPRSYKTQSGDVASVMERADCGRYITYESHRKEIESLQARLKALESKQRNQFSATSSISEHVEREIKEVVGKLVREEYEQFFKYTTKYNGDPCHNTVDSILAELPVGQGKTVKDDFTVAGELTKNSKFTFDTAHRAPKEFKSYSIARDSSLDSKMATCYYTAGTAFIKGCEYEYEVDECKPDLEPGIINITEDEMASELEGEYRWDAVRYGNSSIDGYDSGTAYAIIKPNGNVVAKFYIK